MELEEEVALKAKVAANETEIAPLKTEIATLKTELTNIKTAIASKTIDWEEREFQPKLAIIQSKIGDFSSRELGEVTNVITNEILKSIKPEETSNEQ